MPEKKIRYYSLREVKKVGKQDGRSWRWKFMPPSWPFWETKEPDPPVNQKEPSQYEATLISISHENLERTCKAWSEEDHKLTENYCNAKRQRDALKSLQEDETEEHEDALISLEKARLEFSKYPPTRWPLIIYCSILCGIVIGESFINYLVFQLFGQTETETLLMAAATIIVIVLASELIGYNLKKEKKSGMDKIWIVAGMMSTFALLIAIAILRETFFEKARSAGILDINISPAGLTAIFIIINIAFFIGLTYLSYTESRRNPGEYRKARQAYEDALKKVDEAGEDNKKYGKELAKAEELFIKAFSAREHAFEEYKHTAEEERDKWVGCIRTYRHADMSARKDKTLPESFRIDPETLIKIPAVFEKLEWECPGDKDENT